MQAVAFITFNSIDISSQVSDLPIGDVNRAKYVRLLNSSDLDYCISSLVGVTNKINSVS